VLFKQPSRRRTDLGCARFFVFRLPKLHIFMWLGRRAPISRFLILVSIQASGGRAFGLFDLPDKLNDLPS
jgi:hypothetical protein